MDRTNMANPERGEVDLPIRRKSDGEIVGNYVLKMGLNVGIALSKRIGKPLEDCLLAIQNGDLEAIREFAFCVLQMHHSAEVLTPEDAGDVIDRAGGLEPFFDVFNALMKESAPEGRTANPRKASRRTGAASSLKPAV